ncbi:unnamed protein product [Caenorhabditis sp. 36 PRJEB53466]|nr:unnamed protein product [Caenorhabditis sp. 36 PRJEB53466]
MHRLSFISLALLVCFVNAGILDSLLGNENDKKMIEITSNDQNQPEPDNARNPVEETGLALLTDDQPISNMDDLTSEGQSGVVIRAKRYYGCGCGCCGCGCCGTVAPAATVMPCGCGCCGCGWG